MYESKAEPDDQGEGVIAVKSFNWKNYVNLYVKVWIKSIKVFNDYLQKKKYNFFCFINPVQLWEKVEDEMKEII